MKIRPFQALYPNLDFVASPDSFCLDAKTAFQEFVQNGLVAKTAQDALYILQIERPGGHLHTGLVACNALSDFYEGKIKKHENTLSEKEQSQMQLFLRWHAILKPVLLVYRKVDAINEWILAFAQKNAPFFEVHFEKDDQIHRAWTITDGRDIRDLQALFAENVPETYIADGHHRTTTVALLHERLKDKNSDFNFSELFCAYFPSDQMEILDYNRAVEGLLKDVSPMRFMAQLAEIFDIEFMEKAGPPRRKHELTMCAGKEWFRLKWRKNVLEKHKKDVATLDATLLNRYVLEEILKIKDVRTDTRISYIEGSKGPAGVEDAVGTSGRRIGFMLFPVTLDDLMSLADAGQVLPPKSTYFEPRLRSGLIVKEIKD